jgi:L-fuconolactonase
MQSRVVKQDNKEPLNDQFLDRNNSKASVGESSCDFARQQARQKNARGLSAGVFSPARNRAQNMTMRIDSHQHFWQLERGDYGWITPKLPAIYRDFGPVQLDPLLFAARIEKTILVQAAPTEAETRFLLTIAGKTPFVAGVVGWTDFEARDADSKIATLAENPLLVGLRPMVQDIKDEEWLLRKTLRFAFEAMAEKRLVFDALIRPQHLPRLRTLAQSWPEITFVIDHAAKPSFERGIDRSWFEAMAVIARLPNVYCKLSGIVTEIGNAWEPEHVQPVVRLLLSEYGAGRVLWGSDWPVLNLTADYQRWLACCERLLAPCTEAERAAIFGGNAERVYLTHRGRK